VKVTQNWRFESAKIGANGAVQSPNLALVFQLVGKTKIGGRMEEFGARICQNIKQNRIFGPDLFQFF